MKVSLTGPRMGPDVSVYIEEIQHAPFKAGAVIDSAGTSPETTQKIAALIGTGYAFEVVPSTKARKEKEE
jgi:hypothetical protein